MSLTETKEHDAIRWLDQYGEALYRFAMIRVHDSFTAEDLVQETLLAAYRSYGNFSGKSTVKTWLTGILKNKIADFFRKLRPEHGDENLDDFASGLGTFFDKKEKWKIKPGEWGGDPKNIFERRELMAAIRTCLTDMPKKTAYVYTMRELEGKTTNEICEQIQTGENNCWVILYRARMMLRHCLEVSWFGGNQRSVIK
jgi:RNA polymerase sigma-70 factor, ECF subfamily